MPLEKYPRLRVVLAAGLAALYPGLGHVLLWRWWRALGWFGLSLVSALLVVSLSDVTVPAGGGLDGAIALQRALPIEATLLMLVVSLLNVVDAIRLARQTGASAAASDADTCPSCGEELDEDLDFCPWCTTRL